MKESYMKEHIHVRNIILYIVVLLVCFAVSSSGVYAESGSIGAPTRLPYPYLVTDGSIRVEVYNDGIEDNDGIQIFSKYNDEDWKERILFHKSLFGENSYYRYFENAKKSGIYQYKYRFYKGDEVGDFTEVNDDTSLLFLSPPNITGIKSKGNKTTVTWEKDKYASYYLLRVVTDEKNYHLVGNYRIDASASSYTVTIPGNYLGKPLVYRLTAKADNTTSLTSTIKSINLKTPSVLSGLKTNASQIHLYWYAIAGAGGYNIYRYDNKSNKYDLIKTLNGGSQTSFIDTGKTPGTTYTYYVQAVRTIGERVSESGMSRTVTVSTHPAAALKNAKLKRRKKAISINDIDAPDTATDFIDYKGWYSVAHEYGNYIYVRRINQKTLKVVKTIKIKKKKNYWFGNMICDNAGNYYIAWGRRNTTEKKKKVTFAVSKYNYSGKHIKTTNGDASYNVKSAFFGNMCAMAIDGDNLVCIFGRTMYKSGDGINHQASQTFAVNTKTMKRVYNGYNNYVSHSLAQRVISLPEGGVLFADLGDAHPRGFNLNDNKKIDNAFFHFHGPLGDIDTNSALGDIASVSTGYVLTGAANKSLKTLNGTKQVFIQVINPITGESILNKNERKGTSCGNKVTDRGIKWLTNYKDGSDILYVKSTVLDKELILVMWYRDGGKKKVNGTYYTIVTPNGKVVKPATRIGNIRLNSFSRLQVIGNYVYWPSGNYHDDRKLCVNRMKISAF